MTDEKMPVEEAINAIANILKSGPMAEILDQPHEQATNWVIQKLRRGKIVATAEKYCLVAKHPSTNDWEVSVILPGHFWKRWSQAPANCRSSANGDWRWTNGDQDQTGEVARNVDIAKIDSDELCRQVEKISKRGSGGRPSLYPHYEIAGAIAAEILALPVQTHTGDSVGAMMRQWYENQNASGRDLQIPGDSMLAKQGTEILKGIKSKLK